MRAIDSVDLFLPLCVRGTSRKKGKEKRGVGAEDSKARRSRRRDVSVLITCMQQTGTNKRHVAELPVPFDVHTYVVVYKVGNRAKRKEIKCRPVDFHFDFVLPFTLFYYYFPILFCDSVPSFCDARARTRIIKLFQLALSHELLTLSLKAANERKH